MNQERQKTDAIADAAEIPEGATHYWEGKNNSIFYFKYDKEKWFSWNGFDDWFLDEYYHEFKPL